MVIKAAPKQRLDNEREVLEAVRDHSYVRQMIDTTEDPPSLVLNYLDENLLRISGQKRIEGSDLKLVARNLLEALAALHENGFVHTGKTSVFQALAFPYLTLSMVQMSNRIMSLSITAAPQPGSAKSNWATAVMRIGSTPRQIL